MSTQKILPGSTIGILGGGQLGRMISLAGRNLGFRFAVMDPTQDCPCGQVADVEINAVYSDVEAAASLAQQSDVITYEFENVDASVAEVLEQTSYVPQGSKLLYTTQHRIREKKAIEQAGAKVAPYFEIHSLQQLEKAAKQFDYSCVLKTATGGYDGKGQWVIRSEQDVIPAYETLTQAGTDLVLEKFIQFELELSVIAARNPAGEVKAFPVAENIHVDNILHLSIVPARITREIAAKAEQMALKIAEGMDVIGLIAVEMFLTRDGEIYVNELAPRPHNSGHYTMDACKTSQFEQHVRAICNLPLGQTDLLTPVVMVNILGEHVQPVLEWMEEGQPIDDSLTAKIHFYGKKEAKTKRKMGHINLLGNSVDDAIRWVERSGIWNS
ncbi:5-(carboxyamino)imidazole ribonucleotide synthase [Marinicrinis lubricantis]|uniref:N5-carboxyaminoimidazole ribonucleotide synthase n=1 Tax=Marinicrinis lubricantis TaxID=2086470 RepID=A0ABW1IUC1_9BACL